MIAGGLLLTFIAICVQHKEYEHKKKIGYQFVQGDFKCTGRNAFALTIAGWCIGFITALTGIGSGVMCNSVMLRLDLHPRVAVQTGQFIGTPIAYTASICMLIYG